MGNIRLCLEISCFFFLLSFLLSFFLSSVFFWGWEGLTNLQITKLFCPSFARNRLRFDKVFCLSVPERDSLSTLSKFSSVHWIRFRHGPPFTTLCHVGNN